MNLCIDCGNSKIKWGLFDENKLVEKGTTSYYEYEFYKTLFSKYGNTNTILCSVTKTDDKLTYYLKDGSLSFTELTANTPIPITNKYEQPERLGADRLAAAIGANALKPHKDCLIIDLGTAATFDFINSKGEYSGGNISAGLSLRLKSLSEHTERLPLVDHTQIKTEKIYGGNTEEALSLGAVYGMTFEIIGYMTEAKKENDVFTFLTGGNADFFEKRLKSDIFASILESNNISLDDDLFTNPDLVLTGLNKIIEYNK